MTTITRNADFSTSGEYTVTIGNLTHTIYRDPENGWWYEDVSGKHFSQCCIGFNKKEAVQALEKRATESLVETVLAGAPVGIWKASEPVQNAFDQLDEVIDRLERSITAAPAAGGNRMQEPTAAAPVNPTAQTVMVDAALWQRVKFFIEGMAIMGTVKQSNRELHVQVVELARSIEGSN